MSKIKPSTYPRDCCCWRSVSAAWGGGTNIAESERERHSASLCVASTLPRRALWRRAEYRTSRHQRERGRGSAETASSRNFVDGHLLRGLVERICVNCDCDAREAKRKSFPARRLRHLIFLFERTRTTFLVRNERRKEMTWNRIKPSSEEPRGGNAPPRAPHPPKNPTRAKSL